MIRLLPPESWRSASSNCSRMVRDGFSKVVDEDRRDSRTLQRFLSKQGGTMKSVGKADHRSSQSAWSSEGQISNRKTRQRRGSPSGTDCVVRSCLECNPISRLNQFGSGRSVESLQSLERSRRFCVATLVVRMDSVVAQLL